MDTKKIMILDKDGKEKEAEVVLFFKTGNPLKKYIIYTLNEKDENDMVILYSSVVDEEDGKPIFNGIATDEEWAMIKDVMKKIIVDWKGE